MALDGVEHHHVNHDQRYVQDVYRAQDLLPDHHILYSLLPLYPVYPLSYPLNRPDEPDDSQGIVHK